MFDAGKRKIAQCKDVAEHITLALKLLEVLVSKD